jgi:hypothetical protein
MGELRNPTAVRWDWDKMLREAKLCNPFPRGITFADVDSETEIGGNFLVIEGKRPAYDGTPSPLSGEQLYTMRKRVADGRTCLVHWGIPPDDIRFMQHFGCERPHPATIHDFFRFVKGWASWAEQHPRMPSGKSTFSCTYRHDGLVEARTPIFSYRTGGSR